MSQKVQITIVDDIDGTEGATSIEFGLDGHRYSIDLAGKNMEELRAVFAPLIAVATRLPADKPKRHYVRKAQQKSTGTANKRA